MKRVLLKTTISKNDLQSIATDYSLVIVSKPITPIIQDKLIEAKILFIDNCPEVALEELKNSLSLMDDLTLSELYTYCLKVIKDIKNSTVID